jgi:hypothetical protein
MLYRNTRPLVLFGLLSTTVFPSFQAQAAENFNLRINGGTLGRELFVPVAPGHYISGTAAYSSADKLFSNDGKDFSQSQTVGAFTVPIAVKFKQTQKNINFRYLYVSEAEIANGKLGFSAAMGYVEKSRNIGLTPSFPAGMGAGARNNVNNQLRATEAQQNTSRGGITDAELGTVMTWEFEKSKLAATFAVSVPTGSYDAKQQLNAGNGDFYTFKPSIGYGYVFDNGLQLGGRVLYGKNTKNKDTNYKTGDFYLLDAIAMYQFGPVNLGLNLYQIEQISRDTGATVAAHGNKLKIMGTGLTAAMPTPIGGLEIKYIQDLSGRNARQSQSISLRLSTSF